MKKKILLILPTFEIGGTVVSTKNLILLLDKAKYEINVLCMTGIGSMKDMYNDIQLIPTTFTLSNLTHNSWKDETNIFKRLFCGFIRKISKIRRIKKLLLKTQTKKITTLNYDTIVACQEGICTEFVSYIECKNKIAWVRCDYSRYIKYNNKYIEEQVYSKYNNIVCVSDLISKRFKEIYPQYANKTIAINNPQCEEYILNQSHYNDKDLRFKKNGYTIVSVGRYDPIKRFSEIPRIASSLISKNIEFRWYIIGDGSSEEKKLLQENIAKEKVEENVICLGIKTNPHYYIKESDIMVCLSSSEACPRVINEAKILNIPTISTDFDTVFEYIENDKSGLISSIETIHDSIANILQNKDLYAKIKAEISNFSFDNSSLIRDIEKVL